MAASESALIAVETGHQIDLIRYANTMGANVNHRLTSISKKVREVLYKWDTLDTKKKMNEAINEISAYMEKELGKFTDEFESDVKALIKEEIDFQYGVAKQAIGTGVAVSRPTIKATTQLINSVPMVLNGSAISVDDYIGDYTPNQIKKVKQIITGGWANGLTTREVAQQITGTKTVNGVLQTSQRSAYMMAKDITSHTSSQSKAKVFQENDDLIIGEKTITTLDSKTSEICRFYGSQDGGGKEWLYSEYGRNFPRPGFHQHCRSTNIPILAIEYRVIAEEGRERPAVIDGKAKTVPATTNWYDLAKANPILAEQSLGASRAKLLSEMSAKEFVDTAYNRLGTQLTLDEMKAKNPRVLSILGE
ncbi:putative head morphogenesis protein [Vibrio phage 1.085.O._10N.222.51.E3]|nr:putative head morphogenesis protein [Vibrio phage 1.085.O._10N.222.51.E3]AUR88621.1 putative head morphogenesis protein [Vibrio phage 1.116.O._10N.222.52.C10]AUR89871.1 putative head morphogenesis protein [Vibrio phage 1.134.O._10N.222.52.B8]AUR92419.1 putative head morphogenesis protein [Vibrio phage 1.172.O._10N.261.52.F5]AUR92706.1 putative head morphogenesis protein [Vibrio phage 1.176.O._10N.261.55.F5]